MLEIAEYLIKVGQEINNKYEVRCCMASRMEWHLPMQEEADWLDT